MQENIKSLSQKIFGTLGYRVTKIGRLEGGVAYDQIRPHATYSPWNIDEDFKKVYERVTANTLVDVYRCYELWNLVRQSAKLSAGALIEVGVWRGGTGAIIAKQAQLSGINDTVYLCDTFKGVVKAGTEDTRYKSGEHADTSKQIVETLLQNVGATHAKILEGIFPDDTAHLINESKFRFCHIDVDVYQSATDVLTWVWGKLVHGGIVVYDDFGFRGCEGIVKHIEEQIPREDRLVLQNLNGHAILVKLS